MAQTSKQANKPLKIYADGRLYLTLFNNEETQNNPLKQPEHVFLTNCKNCGAILKGATCEYCGTKYADRGEISENIFKSLPTTKSTF